jgi:hypothetical protein
MARDVGDKLDEHTRTDLEHQVEGLLLTCQWSIKRVDLLADEFGVTRRTVYNARQRINDRRIAEAEAVDPRASFEDWMARLKLGQSLALQERQLSSYNRLLRTEAQVLGYDKGENITVRHVGHDGGPIQVEQVVSTALGQLSSMSDRQLAALIGESHGETIDTDDDGRPLLDKPRSDGRAADAGRGDPPADPGRGEAGAGTPAPRRAGGRARRAGDG